MVRELAAAVMWLSGTHVLQVVDVESQLVLVERIKDRIAEQMVD